MVLAVTASILQNVLCSFLILFVIVVTLWPVIAIGWGFNMVSEFIESGRRTTYNWYDWFEFIFYLGVILSSLIGWLSGFFEWWWVGSWSKSLKAMDHELAQFIIPLSADWRTVWLGTWGQLLGFRFTVGDVHAVIIDARKRYKIENGLREQDICSSYSGLVSGLCRSLSYLRKDDPVALKTISRKLESVCEQTRYKDCDSDHIETISLLNRCFDEIMAVEEYATH